MHVADHKLETWHDPYEELGSVYVHLGRWRTLPVHVAEVWVAAPVGVQHHAIECGHDLDVPVCVSRDRLRRRRDAEPAMQVSACTTWFEALLCSRRVVRHVAATDIEAAAVVGLAVLVVQALAAYERGVKGPVNRKAH